ncbi:MAG: SRPBCC domain-containing protein [Ignavibacteria bacterium]|nr:SRPBCC domain-containing protein [Ignavibacteria bacterium]
MEEQPFVIERTYNAPAEKMWKAITDKADMKKWYFDLAEFRPEVGFEFSFTAGDNNKSYLHLCRVTEVVEGKKLAYTWRYDGYEGDSEVSWELFEEEGKTRVKLVHSGLDTFPAEKNPDLARKNFEQGWNEILGKSLMEYLEN